MICFRNTRIGRIGIGVENGKVTSLYFENYDYDPKKVADSSMETPLHKNAFSQLDEYLAGNRKAFDLPLAPSGTEFMENVWAALLEIPYGKTACYQEVAVSVGSPKAVRAVGLANNRNPIPIFIPCHRVIGKNGKLVGFGGGLDLKQKLLDLERENAGFGQQKQF
ncbi:methylated-DNA--[protein]-cysteine S-methyltransferase [Methanolapillus millepedarum]|uniref:Methylated-DNA--protein-cysteine methyltransferase n=1 Tax=Methanolapillus millepedarum TaxID=3028296 RepID=A0AA96V255_9EURY|nr:Methylated-DNA--protein-cysteine methyltransferase, constitutive [Methanosarcinaceae archaeon Ac7]